MIGSKLAHFQITSHLGSGGMGDVYQATDSKLGRSVAIKLLPEAFARDTDRVARFEREARVLASLNHPNIAAIYGLERSDLQNFLVMELVDGETLAQRIHRGAIPVDEALGMAKQIAEALEAAHEKGVVHRDLKPANIKITPDGKVKVLDFGLAKAYETNPASPNISNSPTLMSAASMPGMILGTAAYMSPEQAKSRTVDKRTDIFAFGCVLYEMLTGRRAFEGEDVSDILSAVLRTEPDWKRLPADLPPRVRELIELCLQKDPKRRLRDAGDLGLYIDRATHSAGMKPAATSSRVAWIVTTAVMTLAFVSLAVINFRQKPSVALEMRVEITTPSTMAPLEFALSPDGLSIVFVASGDGLQRLWLRALNKTEAQPLTGSEGADYPFWSPDSRSVGFFATGKLKRIDINGGPPQVLANAAVGRGGTWNAEGVILFSQSLNGQLFRIPATGGTPVAVTRLDQAGHRFPQFLPDNHHFLFYVPGAPETAGIYLGSLDGGDPKRLTAADTSGTYLASGWVLFIRQTALIAQRLDLKLKQLIGDPITVADPVGSIVNFGGVSASADGRLAYRSGNIGLRHLVWRDSLGKAAGEATEPDPDSLLYPELSPDGQRIAIDRTVQNNVDVWMLELVRGGKSRLTVNPARDGFPVWSPDGTRIAFSSDRKGAFNVYLKPSNGSGAEELLLETPLSKYPHDWSKDGRFLLYSEENPKTGRDLWALPMTGNDRKPIAIANTPFDELNGQFSPDGHWVAYETNEAGPFEVVVQPFPDLSAKWQVSTKGGVQPRWRPDGKELYFVAPDGKLMDASIKVSGTTFAAAAPVPLFFPRLSPGAGVNKQEYAVFRDGRFLLNELVEAFANTPITLLLNWKPKAAQ